jgi:hypothetical protein
MAKFLKVAISPSVDSGTTDGVPSGANDLIDAGQNFLTTVSVGDYVHNTTDDAWHVVSAVVDNENLTLESGTVATGKAYTIYDGDSDNFTDQLVGVDGAVLVEQATVSTTTIAYAGGSTGTDVLTISHGALAAGSLEFRTNVQDALINSQQSNWQNVTETVTIPSGIVVTGIAIA